MRKFLVLLGLVALAAPARAAEATPPTATGVIEQFAEAESYYVDLDVQGTAAGLEEPGVAATLISKPPDVGPFWNPLRSTGTQVYSDSFIAPGGPDVVVNELGTWLEYQSNGAPSIIALQVWGDNAGPNCNNVIATTADFSTNMVGLNLHTRPAVGGPRVLTPGTKYWFVATAANRGANPGSYRVGGHTQNSVYPDNGTFWYANDANGCAFDGRNLTPEMAFQVNLGPQQEPACICGTNSRQEPFCFEDALCNTLEPCQNGACPPGFTCLINSCCGEPVCIRDCGHDPTCRGGECGNYRACEVQEEFFCEAVARKVKRKNCEQCPPLPPQKTNKACAPPGPNPNQCPPGTKSKGKVKGPCPGNPNGACIYKKFQLNGICDP